MELYFPFPIHTDMVLTQVQGHPLYIIKITLFCVKKKFPYKKIV